MTHRRDFVTRLPLALFGATVATTFGTGAFAQDPRTVTVAFPMDILSWDPVTLNPTQSAIIKCVYDQPLELAPDLKFGPSVVSDFKWLNKNCTLLEMSFRDGVTFHNGDKLAAADFKFSFFDRPRAQKASLLAGVWSAIESIEVPTPLKAVVKFSAPMAIAPVMFADIPAYILPKAYYEKVGKDGFEARPVGSGPYKLVEYQRDQRIVLEAYEGYWRGPAKVKRLVFQVTKDPTARAAAIQSGQADLTMNIPVREAERLGALPGLAPHLDSTTGVVFLQMANKGILTDRNVRLACHHAIDKAAISKAGRPGLSGLRARLQGRIRPREGEGAARGLGLQRSQSGEAEFLYEQRRFRERLRHGARDRTDVAEGRHRGQPAGARQPDAVRISAHRQVRRSGAQALQPSGRR
jgi:peptide/nickel transport system substrate-binding protein